MTPAVSRYVTLLSASFWGGLAVVFLGGWTLPETSAFAIAPLVGFAISAEALVVSREHSSASFSVAAHIAAAILFGPFVAALVAAVGVILVDGIRLGPRRAVLLNSAVFGCSAFVGGVAFTLVGGSVGTMTERDLVATAVLIVVRFAANELLIAVVISLDTGARILRILQDSCRDLAGSAVGEGCLGVLVAFGYAGPHWIILPFLLPLLVGLYTAQLNFERLKRETAAALNTFARVIDERDPNTASHSKRVAVYVEQFVAAIDLPDREATRLVDAARYHDLGKVNVDEHTLSRSGRLTEQELRRIRSHPALSARLLSPFHFAREMALYAELHHERYDGTGYYSVPQREIPVEAHVLIVADSFDAMTSARAYRQALTTAEAIQELRDKAGSQFHPLVAEAFAAMMEGRELRRAMGDDQLAALQTEFSRVATVRLPHLRGLLHPRLLAVCLAPATAISLGLPIAPRGMTLLCGALTIAAGSTALAVGLNERHRRRKAQAAIAAGSPATHALAAARIAGCIGWLHWNDSEQRYHFAAEEGTALPKTDVDDLELRAVRVGPPGRRGTLESGRCYVLAPAVGQLPRLTVCTHWRLSEFEVGLVDEVGHARASNPPAGAKQSPTRDRRKRNAKRTRTSLYVKLEAFEDVRSVAGQLSAERMVTEAAAKLAGIIRDGDHCQQVGDDRFVVSLRITSPAEIEAVCERIRMVMSRVPVPRRARPIRPSIRLMDDADAANAVWQDDQPDHLRAAS